MAGSRLPRDQRGKLVALILVSGPVSPSSPSTEMRSDFRKCRSFCVKDPASPPARRRLRRSRSSCRRNHFVEADRGLQHQQNIEAVLADVLHHPGNLLALDDRLMDGLAQLLNQFPQTGCHEYLQERRPRAKRRLRHEFSTLLPFPSESNPGAAAQRKHGAPRAAATIINGMRPRYIGRALGIGVRVTGRFAGQVIADQTQSGAHLPPRMPQASAAQGFDSAVGSRAAGQAAGKFATQTGRNFSQGVGGFLRPFRRVGGILWLEVTGVFFLLPVIVFGPTLWRAGVGLPAYRLTTGHSGLSHSSSSSFFTWAQLVLASATPLGAPGSTTGSPHRRPIEQMWIAIRGVSLEERPRLGLAGRMVRDAARARFMPFVTAGRRAGNGQIQLMDTFF